MRRLIYVVACAGILSCSQNGGHEIVINSCVLRNRVVVLDRIVMKKALYVAFTLPSQPVPLPVVKVRGALLWNGEGLADAVLYRVREPKGNLVFDLPAEISEGRYTVRIEAIGERGETAAQGSLTIDRQELRSTIEGKNMPSSSGISLARVKRVEKPSPTDSEQKAGYIIFDRSTWERKGMIDVPSRSEVIDGLSVRVVRNEYEPVTFSIYPLRTLGQVRVTTSKLMGKHGELPKDSLQVGHIESLTDYPWNRTGAVVSYPQVIKRGEYVSAEAGSRKRFWLTLHIGADVAPGEYRGAVTITPQHGAQRRVPLVIAVEPVLLEDIPGKDYFMLMTYEFTELTMPWTAKEKEKIYQAAYNILKDYRAHGMTTVCIHSPFVLMSREDVSPQLEDIYATLRAARDLGFTRIIWYMGHLVQTAKPRHPGNILAFDAAVHLPRLRMLVQDVTAYAKRHGCPEVVVLPIDEPDDQIQDPGNMRHAITPRLLQTIKDSGARTMLTSRTAEGFGPVDFLCSSDLNDKELASSRRKSRTYWIYNNDVTTKCDNPAYARYMYGYYTWLTGIEGMSSWTFQNTQNANGTSHDVFLAYPDPQGPLATLKWEAIREGIDDHKYIYQMEKRIAQLKKNGLETADYDAFLETIRARTSKPSCLAEGAQEQDGSFFDANRVALISMIVEADKRLLKQRASMH